MSPTGSGGATADEVGPVIGTLERRIRGEGFFRAIYLFPMAISLIAVAIIWRWLMSNATGAQQTGLNRLFSSVGLDFLVNDWFKADRPFAVMAVAIAAGWALSGYIMALFLAGMLVAVGTYVVGTVSREREQQTLDGLLSLPIERSHSSRKRSRRPRSPRR